ncbi:MAG: hypothetical protein WCB94_03010 [Terriglobales bacterium]
MKFTKSFILILALALLAVPIAAQTNAVNNSTSCSLATLNGSYGVLEQGTFLAQLPGSPPPPFLAVNSAIATYDGAGHVSGTNTASFGGVIVPGTFTGTYTVNSDCTYSMEFTALPLGVVLHETGTITGRGMFQEIHLIYKDPFLVASGTAKKMPPGGCSQETLKGRYTVFGQGLATLPGLPPLLPGAHVGIFAADGSGHFAGEDTITIAGMAGPDTFTAKYTVNPDCTMTAAITTSVGVLNEVGTITGMGRFQESRKIIVEPGWVLADTDKKQ